jgi:thioredoxin-related protein
MTTRLTTRLTFRITLLTSATLLLACSKAPEVAAPAPKPSPVAEVKAVPVAAAQVVSIAWVKPEGTQIDKIFAQARADNKPVFLYWGAVWCPPCNQIKATVFNRPDFVERSKLFVPVYLDGDTPGAQKLAAQFKVRGYPTMILFKPDGTELTRLPGEVDAAQYMQVLGMGLVATHSVKDSLTAILAKGTDAATVAAKAAVTPDAWRMLAYYSWDTDEARLLPKAQVASALQTLSQTCPPELKDASNRLALKAMALAAQEKLPGFDRAAALKRVQQVLADPAAVRDNFDMLAYYANDIVPALATPKSAERAPLVTAWNAALDTLAADATLSKSDRLTAVYAKVALTRVDAAKDTKPPVDAALITQARDMVTAMNTATTDKYERQAVIPSAADLLSEVGLLNESDALLNAELPKAVSPYYHMLVLAANAKTRGDKAASLNWSEKAYDESVGAATRLQWGTGYVGKLLDLSPQDAPRIEKAVGKIIAELEATPETFYERNRRSLERMGSKLNGWNANGSHSAVLKKLNAQMAAVCAKLPAQDEAAQACGGVFKAKPVKAKA